MIFMPEPHGGWMKEMKNARERSGFVYIDAIVE
jgi:hypothetical protein